MKIELNGKPLLELKFSEAKTVELPLGKHMLIAKMGWTRSLPLSITFVDNDHKWIVVDHLPLLVAGIKSYIPPFVTMTLKEVSTIEEGVGARSWFSEFESRT